MNKVPQHLLHIDRIPPAVILADRPQHDFAVEDIILSSERTIWDRVQRAQAECQPSTSHGSTWRPWDSALPWEAADSQPKKAGDIGYTDDTVALGITSNVLHYCAAQIQLATQSVRQLVGAVLGDVVGDASSSAWTLGGAVDRPPGDRQGLELTGDKAGGDAHINTTTVSSQYPAKTAPESIEPMKA